MGTAFLITAAIQVVFVIGCTLCGRQSLLADQEEAQKEMDAKTATYERVAQDPNQIPM